MKDKLKFNKKPRFKSNCLYRFNRYLTSMEKGNYKLFVQSYYKLTPDRVKYWRKNPFWYFGELVILKKLFFWLICNTSIDDNRQTTNKEIREAFFKDYPELINHNGYYACLIGIFLTGLYAPDLIKNDTDKRRVTYNIRVHDTPIKEITVTNLE